AANKSDRAPPGRPRGHDLARQQPSWCRVHARGGTIDDCGGRRGGACFGSAVPLAGGGGCCGSPSPKRAAPDAGPVASLAAEPHTPLGQFCSPYHANTALHPMINLLERAAGLPREDPPERQLHRLEAMLAVAVGDVCEAAALLADLLGIPAVGRYPPL